MKAYTLQILTGAKYLEQTLLEDHPILFGTPT